MTVTALASLTVEQVPIDALHPDPANPRRISEDELDPLYVEVALRRWERFSEHAAVRLDG